MTERNAGKVTRVNPRDGSKATVLTIGEVLSTPGEQDGLLGMALHPDLLNGTKNQYVYLSYIYDVDPGPGLDRRQKLVRYTYDAAAAQLVQPLPTREEIDHQDWTAYQGKTLRLNLDGSIPADNPRIGGVRSHINTHGHRNAQGLVFGKHGLLYSSEQGPKSDDEINLLEAGGNYGWPRVAGFKDDSGYVFGDWSAAPGCGTTVPYDAFVILDVVPQYAEHTFEAKDFVPPLRTYYTVPSTHDFKGDACKGSGLYFICYPTIAPSSLDFYAQDAIPGWSNSLLMPTLKDCTVYRVAVTGNGRNLGKSQPLWTSVNRYRDTAISADGTTIYVATDKDGLARGKNGDATSALENPGAILVFHYTGAGK